MPPNPACPRYSELPLPAYRYVPGVNPHPRRHREGHGYGQPEPSIDSWQPEQWRSLVPYLYGVDLFNFAYWWECHEQLEALWHAAGKTTPPAQFVQGILQVAAANLNHHLGKIESARSQAEAGLTRIRKSIPEPTVVYMGVNIAELAIDARAWLAGQAATPALIRLDL